MQCTVGKVKDFVHSPTNCSPCNHLQLIPMPGCHVTHMHTLKLIHQSFVMQTCTELLLLWVR